MDFTLAFADKEITPWSGMIFMKKLLDQTGILTKLVACDLPEQQSNRGDNPIQLITSFMVSIFSWSAFGVEPTDLNSWK